MTAFTHSGRGPNQPIAVGFASDILFGCGSQVSGGGFSEAVQDQQGNEAGRGYPEEKRRSRNV